MAKCVVNATRVQGYLDSLTKQEMAKANWFIRRLEEYGRDLQLKGQWAKVVQNSRHQPELLELRVTAGRSIIRIAYYIDKHEVAHLLWGDDKRGQKEPRFYKRLILESDRAIDSIKQQQET